MRSSLFLILLLTPLFAGCQSRPVTVPDIAPDSAAWQAEVQDAQRVGAYAASLDRLNPGTRGAFDLADGVTLAEAEALALLLNADLRVARLKARVPQLGARHAGLPEDPRLELDLLRILQSVNAPWVAVSGLKFTIPLAGRLAAEKGQARAAADSAVRAAQLAEWQTVIALREAWTEWSAVHERRTLLTAHIESIDSVLEMATARRKAGQIGAPQLRSLQIERVTRAGQLQALAATDARALLTLKAIMGLTPYAEVSLIPELGADLSERSPEAEDALLREVSLELALAKAEYVTAHHDLRLEASKRFPDMELGPLFESEEGIEKLGAGVGVSIPLWNRNRRAIAEACATRSAARAAYQARYQALVGRLAATRADRDAAVTRAAWLREQVAPLADQQLADVRRLGELGDMDVLILKEALGAVLEAKTEILDAQVDRAQAAGRRRALLEPLQTPMTQSLSK